MNRQFHYMFTQAESILLIKILYFNLGGPGGSALMLQFITFKRGVGQQAETILQKQRRF